jgi:hypothetical protein
MSENLTSVYSEFFLARVQTWIAGNGEVFVVIRYSHRGGMRDYVIVNDNVAFAELLKRLPPKTEVIVMADKFLELRGIANEELLSRMNNQISPGKSYVLLELGAHDPLATKQVEFESPADIASDYEDFRGCFVAFGETPAWHLPDHERQNSARVPFPDGQLASGLY